MSHTYVEQEAVPTMNEPKQDGTRPGAGARRTFASELSELIANPNTTYRLRQLIQGDEILRHAASLSDEVLLARLDTLVREDAAIVGAREVPPGPVLHTAQERAEAFKHANALNRLEGYEPSQEFLELQARVIAGEISIDELVHTTIERAQARDAAKK